MGAERGKNAHTQMRQGWLLGDWIEVLRHFDGFISKLATRTFRDANNVSFSGVDQEMKERMQLKLIASIIKNFDPIPK